MGLEEQGEGECGDETEDMGQEVGVEGREDGEGATVGGEDV